MSRNLVFLAGRKALRTIRENGLRHEMVRVVLGAAGGPKWLVLHGLDRVMFSSWFKKATIPLFLLGSSIGALRFAAASQRSPRKALDRFLSAYVAQRYSPDPAPREVTSEGMRVIDALLGPRGAREILKHPFMRLNLVAARCRWPVASDNKVLLGLGLMDAMVYNAIGRSGLQFFFERTYFCDPRDLPPFTGAVDLPTRVVPLSEGNMKPALLASGSIPMVMSGVRNIPGAPKGVYRDGGVIDYHFDLRVAGDNGHDDNLILFPHYTNRIIPGWFDKNLPWRKPHPANTESVVLVSPSPEFIERLPYRKIPDRSDFWSFKGRDDDRIGYWNEVVEASAGLGDDFLEIVESGAIKELVEPLP